jgi:DNA-binding LytR/AlgR family response regulator
VSARLRVVVADDERPARAFLISLLRAFDDVVVVGEAASGKDAVTTIEKERPDLALLDWQMPELDGIGVVRILKKHARPLERIPVRHREEVLIVPVHQIASIVAEGELLHITTVHKDRHTITYRLKDLERRLDPSRFIRLGRGTLANLELITKVSTMPGGTHVALLSSGQKLQVSRLQSRILRERFLKL